MFTELRSRLLVFVSLTVVGLAAVALPGCAVQTAVKTGPTALGSLPVARSELSTTAPDARLYTVQTDQPVASTSTPEWQFVFVSPSTGRAYAVFVSNGQSSPAQELASSGLSSGEGSAIPSTSDSWKIDSDAALTRAFAASGLATSTGTSYLGLETYKANDDTSTIKPFVWRVHIYPGPGGATTRTIDVNATTGATAVIK